MEVATKDISSHAATLLATLNLQREQAQLCDCVVRQTQNPGQLYPAHRCVLAASSPVLATILSFTGALVELHAPCLSDSVLELLLNYIYTGVLPYTCSQQQYYSLLTAACHLEMDDLQEALMSWQQTGVNDPSKTNVSIESEGVYCRIADCPVSNVKSGGCTHESNGPSESQDEEMLKQLLKAKESNRPEEDKTQNNQTPPSLSTSLLSDRGSPSQCPAALSSSSPCCGAVSVICHSSKAASLQLAEVSTMPLCHPVCQASASPCSIPASQSADIDNVSIVKVITAKRQSNNGEQNRDFGNNGETFGEHSWDYGDSSNQGTKQEVSHQSNTDKYDAVKQDYNAIYGDHFIIQKDANGLSHITANNTYYDSLQSDDTTQRGNDQTAQGENNSNYSGELRYDAEIGFEDISSLAQPLELETLLTEKESFLQNQRTRGPRPFEDSNVGKKSHFENPSPKRQAADEHSYSCRTAVDIYSADDHGGHACQPNSHDDEMRQKIAVSLQHERTLGYRHTDMTVKRRSGDGHPPPPTNQGSALHNVTGCLSTSSDFEQIVNIEITEPHITFNETADGVTSEATCSVEETSYHGHLHYCLSKDAYSKHSKPSKPVSFNLEQSSDEGEAEFFASSAHRQQFNKGTGNQILLLDISTKPAELLVSYKNRQKELALGQIDTNGSGVWDNDGTLQSEAMLETGRCKRRAHRDSADEAKTKRAFDVKEGESLSDSDDQHPDKSEVIHKAGCWDDKNLSSFRKGENQNSSLKMCTRPRVPDFIQATVSSSLSVCIPSTLPPSMPTSISPHLSPSAHQPFQCSLCDRSFSQRGSLNRHVRSHLGVRPFPCPRCPMTFSRQYRVTEHMRVHERCALGNGIQKPSALI